MKRLLAPLLLLFVLFIPFAVSAQSNLPLFDPDWQLVPDAHKIDPENCPEGYPLGFAGVLQLIQNGMNAAISFGVIIFVLIIAGAGILWILTPTNPENHSQAKKILTNAVIGLLIILSAWLIVDFVMKLLYNPNARNFGPWNQILTGGDLCIKPMENLQPLFSGNIFSVPGRGTGADSGGPASLGSGSCSPTLISNAAYMGGYPLTQAQANTFSCLAQAESSCGTNISGAKTVDGRPTTAHGMFQIVMGYNDKCHNLNVTVCSSAARNAGWRGSGDLNCSQAFSGGRVKQGQEELARVCRAAAANIVCNVSAAACLLKERPDFGDWTSDPRSTRQKACIATFSGQ